VLTGNEGKNMTTIQVNDQEAELLHSILQNSFSELEMEIVHTDRKEFKDYLKSKESLLRRLIAEVEKSVAITSAH
jgi:hypothetical protein